ncbi:hypothetical protein T05_4331 [Trichinella murrelli]|uniref:Uncharacterized protein n=1 Tax=Trichinella murrelli TaxID=144512 RepID=A0A0V0U2G4_9BILA|nr:hypothetical protein T05_4331 [Trichinella murrelli]
MECLEYSYRIRIKASNDAIYTTACDIRNPRQHVIKCQTEQIRKFGSAASLRENCSYQPCTTFTGTYGPSALFTMSALLAENDKA